jgi:hypothetical protein
LRAAATQLRSALTQLETPRTSGIPRRRGEKKPNRTGFAEIRLHKLAKQADPA